MDWLTDVEGWANTDARLDVLFDRLLLIDMRQLLGQFHRASYTALAGITQPPPQLVLRVIKAVMLLVQPYIAPANIDWAQCQSVSEVFDLPACPRRLCIPLAAIHTP